MGGTGRGVCASCSAKGLPGEGNFGVAGEVRGQMEGNVSGTGNVKGSRGEGRVVGWWECEGKLVGGQQGIGWKGRSTVLEYCMWKGGRVGLER